MSQPTPPPSESQGDAAGSAGAQQPAPSPYAQGTPQQQPYAEAGQQPYPGGYGQAGQPYPQQPYQQQPYQQGATAYGDQPGYGGYPPVPTRPNNTMAVVSLVAGICGLTVLFFVGSIVAVITGMMAKKEIARTGEEGSSLATWGVILGWIGIGLGVLIGLAFLLFWGTMFAAIGTSSYS